MEPCQPLDFVDRGDKVNEAGALAPQPDALFAKELRNLLISLEAACPGYGNEIACVLAVNASEDMNKKVETSLSRTRVRRMRGFARKASATSSQTQFGLFCSFSWVFLRRGDLGVVVRGGSRLIEFVGLSSRLGSCLFWMSPSCGFGVAVTVFARFSVNWASSLLN